VKPVRARFPVSEIRRSRPMRSSISAHSAPVRWSFQRIAGLSTRSRSSRQTRPCIWPERPTRAGCTPSVARAERLATHHCSGSCSDQPGCGVDSGYSSSALAMTSPSGVIAIALTAVVPTSRPTQIGSGRMDAQEIATGLWRWTAFHEEWKEDVGCVYLETRAGVVLIDPLVPAHAAERDRFWSALDRDVERSGGPVHVLVTVFWHTRSADQIVERYGARVWASSRARAAVARRAGTVSDAFRPGDELPGGVEALASGRSTEVVYWLPEQRTLVPGDVLLGSEQGSLRLCPESWLPSGTGHRELQAALRPTLDLPIRRVLVSHGEPVLANGRAAVAAALS
jgi:glyoxylase-like metal-dependent hydrolase (beta-lactamase superfamily II)